MRQSLPMIFGGAREPMFPLPHSPRRNACLLRHFRLGQVGFDAFQQQVIAQSFRIDGNELPATISLLGMVIFNRYGTLCNTQQLTQPPLALSVPLSRFTSRVGGGSAFYVRPLDTLHTMKKHISLLLVAVISLMLGCSKAPHDTNNAVGHDSLTDWGLIEFSEGTQKHLALNDGRDCTLTATALADGNFQVIIETDRKATAEDQAPPGQPKFPVGSSVHLSQTVTIPGGEAITSHVDNRLVRFGVKLKTP